EHPRRPPDAHAFGQARDDTHDELDRGALTVQERAESLQEIATTDHTQQLPPGTATGMAVGAEMAPAHPAARGTIWVGAEVRGGIHLVAAPPRRHDARGRACGGLWARVGAVRTRIAVRLGGELRKGCGRTRAL